MKHPRCFALLALSVASTPLLAFGDAPGNPVGPALDLPVFQVKGLPDMPEPEHWRYARVAGFEVLSECPDRETQALLHDFRRFVQALGIAWRGAQPKFVTTDGPNDEALDSNTALPLSIILCADQAHFDRLRPAGAGTFSDRGLASLFLQHGEQAAIVINLAVKTAHFASADKLTRQAFEQALGQAEMFARENGNPDPRTDLSALLHTAGDNDEVMVDHRRLLCREYVRFVQNFRQHHPPAWLEEGMAQLFAAMKFDRSTITLGQLDDSNAGALPVMTVTEWRDMLKGVQAEQLRGNYIPATQLEALLAAPQNNREGTFNRELRLRVLMPMEELFAVARNSPVATHPLGSLWAKQAEAFVHLCIYGRKQRYQAAFVQWVNRLESAPPSEALFKECFKMSYAEMRNDLAKYVDYTSYKSVQLRVVNDRLDDPPPLPLRDATEAETGRLTGGALRLAGNTEAARAALIAPYLRGARETDLLAALGLAELADNQPDRARRFLEASATRGVYLPRAHLELARLRLGDALAKAGPTGLISPPETVGVLAPLFAARDRPPPLSEVYDLMAEVWQHSALKPDKPHLDVLAEGAQLFPEDLRLLTAATRLYTTAGFRAEAQTMIEGALKNPADEATRTELNRLRAELKP